MKFKIILTLLVISFFSCSGKQTTYRPERISIPVEPIDSVYIYYNSFDQTFHLGNKFMRRDISVDSNSGWILTKVLLDRSNNENYIKSLGKEFSFKANGTEISGISNSLRYVGYEIQSYLSEKLLHLNFKTRPELGLALNVRITYEIYDQYPVVRKWVEIENDSGSYTVLDSILIEWLGVDSIFMRDQGSFTAFFLDLEGKRGLIACNESPGVLKYGSAGEKDIYVGMKPISEAYATEIHLAPGERFVSPAVSMFLFSNGIESIDKLFQEFVDNYLAIVQKRSYRVWYDDNVPDSYARMLSRIKAVKGAGYDIFCFIGDWVDKRHWAIGATIDPPVLNEELLVKMARNCHDYGLKFGVSIDIARVQSDSAVVEQHPEWIMKRKDGTEYELVDTKDKLMCLGSEFTLSVTYSLDEVINRLNLDYLKLGGRIMPDNSDGGCHSKEHLHRSPAESWRYFYEGLFAMISYLRMRHPEIIIDVAPESYDPSGKIDVSLMKYVNVVH